MPYLLGLHPLDAFIVAFCLFAVMAIGFWVSRGVKGETDFFVSGRSMGAWLQFFLNFGQATDSNGAPTIATEVYRQGVGGMWIGFQTLFITPFIWFTSIWFRRTRLITGPDLFIDRFNSRPLATTYALFGVLMLPALLALGNIISYKVASAMLVKPESNYTQHDRDRVAEYKEYRRLQADFTSGHLAAGLRGRYDALDSMAKKGELVSSVSYITPLPFYAVYTLIVAVYITLGGIKAAALTDAFQGLLIIVFSGLMVPVGLYRIGGFRGLHEHVPAYKFMLFGSGAGGDYTWYSIAAIVFTSLVGFGNPNGPSTASGRDETAIRLGTLGGVFLKRFVMICWMLCGLLAVAMFPLGISDPDNAWGVLAGRLLGPGLLGLMISGMLLGHMPAVGTNAVNFSAQFTRNLYEPLVRGRGPGHYLLVAKAAVPGVLVLGAAFSLMFSGVIALLSAQITFQSFFGTAVFLVYFWRKLTAKAVGTGAVLWIAMTVVAAWGLPAVPAFRRAPALVLQTRPRTVDVVAPATAEDVAAGRAAAEGAMLHRTQVVPPSALFFEAVARTNADDPSSPLEGVGRFHVENFICYHLGLPLDRFPSAGLIATRWGFDGVFPFLILTTLSYATAPRRKAVAVPAGPPPEHAHMPAPGGAAARRRPDRTAPGRGGGRRGAEDRRVLRQDEDAGRADAGRRRPRGGAELRRPHPLRPRQALPQHRLGVHEMVPRRLPRLLRLLGRRGVRAGGPVVRAADRDVTEPHGTPDLGQIGTSSHPETGGGSSYDLHPASTFKTPRERFTAMTRCLSVSYSGRGWGMPRIMRSGMVRSWDMTWMEPTPSRRSRKDWWKCRSSTCHSSMVSMSLEKMPRS